MLDEAVVSAGQQPKHHSHAEQIQTNDDAEGAWEVQPLHG
jgi:hypothetical protein